MRRWGLAVAAVLTIAACASGDDDTTDPTIASTAAPTTTSPPDTTTTSTTTTTTSTTTTTVAPTMTIDPTDEIESAIKQARLDGEAAINAAGLDPTDESLRAAVERFNTGARLAETTTFLDQLAADGLAFRPNESEPSTLTFEGPVDLPEGVASTEAFLVECKVDSDVVFVVQDDPLAPEIIVDDRVVAIRARVRYVLRDGQWMNDSGELLTRAEGVATCV